MPKTQTTKDVETALMARIINNNQRFAFEVDVGSGIVDCLASHVSYYVNEPALMYSYEIKISYSDFKSKNGHNFNTHYNYYVVTKKIYHKIKPHVEDHIGILVYNEENESLRKVKDAKYQEMKTEYIIKYMDKMLLKWVSGSMIAEFKRNGFEFKNDVMVCSECGKHINIHHFYKGMCYMCYQDKMKKENEHRRNF